MKSSTRKVKQTSVKQAEGDGIIGSRDRAITSSLPKPQVDKGTTRTAKMKKAPKTRI